MRISSSLLARQPTELLRFRNAELRTQTITTHTASRQEINHCAFIVTNPTDEPITSGLPVTRQVGIVWGLFLNVDK